jgi:mono/diheme cytochrome c family protein
MPAVVRITTAFSLFIIAAGAAATDLGPGDVVAGRMYALQSCSDCHNVVGRRGAPRPAQGAPDFYAIANERTTSIIGLNVFLSSPHRNMPNFIITAEDRRNVVSYIMSLREPR